MRQSETISPAGAVPIQENGSNESIIQTRIKPPPNRPGDRSSCRRRTLQQSGASTFRDLAFPNRVFFQSPCATAHTGNIGAIHSKKIAALRMKVEFGGLKIQSESSKALFVALTLSFERNRSPANGSRFWWLENPIRVFQSSIRCSDAIKVTCLKYSNNVLMTISETTKKRTRLHSDTYRTSTSLISSP